MVMVGSCAVSGCGESIFRVMPYGSG
jgi:hypothetical protein